MTDTFTLTGRILDKSKAPVARARLVLRGHTAVARDSEANEVYAPPPRVTTNDGGYLCVALDSKQTPAEQPGVPLIVGVQYELRGVSMELLGRLVFSDTQATEGTLDIADVISEPPTADPSWSDALASRAGIAEDETITGAWDFATAPTVDGDPIDGAAVGLITTHAADTTDVHGIADTSALVLTTDPRLSDARTPTAHGHTTSDVTGLDAALAGKVAKTDKSYLHYPTPFDYGAVGDGVHDDTAACKQLLAENEFTYWPRCTGYKVSGPLYDTPFTTKRIIIGDDYAGSSSSVGTRIFVDNTVTWDPDKYILHFQGASSAAPILGVTIENVKICGTEGDVTLQTQMNALCLENVQMGVLRNVHFNKIKGVAIDLATTWDTVIINARVFKSGDASVYSATVATASGSNVAVRTTAWNRWDIGADITGTGIPANTRILDISGTTAYLSANATATGSGVTATVTRNCQPIKHRPATGLAVDCTNTINWVAAHIEGNYAGSMLLGRATRRVKFTGAKFHGLLNASISKKPHIRFEGAYANQLAEIQFSRAGRHHVELDAFIDPVTLVADSIGSDANMFVGCYFDSAGATASVSDGTGVRLIKGKNNTFSAVQFEDCDVNVNVDSGNAGNVFSSAGNGMTGNLSSYQAKFTGPFTWLHAHPTTGVVTLRKEDGTWASLLDSSSLAPYAPLASPTFTGTVSGVTKSMVGLGNVDNTADVSKPVSTAQAAADAAIGTAAATDATTKANAAQAAAIAASAQRAANLSDLASASAARTNLGLGTAATQATTAFEVAGAAATAQSAAVQRANHTGTQTASTISDLSTTIDGRLKSLLLAITTPTISPGVVNTTTETDLFSLTIPAAKISSGDLLVLEFTIDALNNTGSSASVTYKVKIGSTTVFTFAPGYTTNVQRFRGEGRVKIALASLTDLRCGLTHMTSSAANLTTQANSITAGFSFVGSNPVTTEDLSTDKTLTVTATPSAASANLDTRCLSAELERKRA